MYRRRSAIPPLHKHRGKVIRLCKSDTWNRPGTLLRPAMAGMALLVRPTNMIRNIADSSGGLQRLDPADLHDVQASNHSSTMQCWIIVHNVDKCIVCVTDGMMAWTYCASDWWTDQAVLLSGEIRDVLAICPLQCFSSDLASTNATSTNTGQRSAEL